MRTGFGVLAATMILLPITGVACSSADAPELLGEVGTQQHAFGPANSCFSYCGHPAPSGCSCETTCTASGTCCSDYPAQCVNGGSCVDNCTSGAHSNGSCACDEACSVRGDCCADYTSVCPDCKVTTRTWKPKATLQPKQATGLPPFWYTDPQVGTAANGDALAVFKHIVPSGMPVESIRATRFTAGAWTPVSTLVSGGVAASPRLEVGAGSHALATFGTNEWIFSPAASWSDAALATTPVAYAVDGTGNKLLLFLTGSTLEARLLTASGVLQPGHSLSTGATMFDVASNAAGDFAVVYNAGSSLMVGTKYNGMAWTSVLVSPTGNSPRIGLDANRRAMVAWIDGTSVRAVRVHGTALGTTVTLASPPETVSNIRLATNASGRSIATWKRDFPSAGFIVFEDQPYSVFAARYTPLSGWNTPTLIASIAERKPSMATAANGITTVVWDGELDDVYARRFE